jgi:hypothetical protein
MPLGPEWRSGPRGTPLSPGARQEFIVAEPSSVPPASTFIVRFWRERSAAGSRWRGRIEHIQSGESTTSPDLQGIVDFFQRHGIMDDRSNEHEEADT